jgi:Tol biopolymer transport system component
MRSIQSMTGRKFIVSRQIRAALFLAALAGVSATLALAGQGRPASAQSPSGKLAFTSYRAGAAQIFTIGHGGSGLTRLTNTRGAAFEGAPAFSPDGRRIANVCGNFELCIMNSDGSSPARLTTNNWPRELRYDRDPAWSPDATKIAFARSTNGHDGIWIVNTDGSGLRQLPVPTGHNANPAWSPDGTTIAFDHVAGSGVTSLGSHSIYVVGVDGGASRPLTAEDSDALDPAWSPDASRIVFSQPNFEETAQHLVVMNADGSGQRRLSTGSLSATDPAWSPDGTRIAFAGRRAGRLLIYAIPVGGGTPVGLTTGRTPDFDPAWQPSNPPVEVPLPAAPPSKATAEARVVASLMQATFEMLAALNTDPTTSTAREAASGAARLRGTVRRARAATTRLAVTTARGKRVRRLLLGSMRSATTLASKLSALSRSLRRHDRRAVRAHKNAVFKAGIAVFFPLTEAAELADVPLAVIAL